MAGSRPPKRPSALDGYRRLERTRSVAAASVIVGAGTVAPRTQRQDRPPRITRARVAGAVRLVGFVAVLALIVGTSVSLASADERRASAGAAKSREDVAIVAPKTVEPKTVERTAVERNAVERNAVGANVTDEPVVERAADAVSVDPDAAAATASGSVPTTALPLTGDAQVRWLLLGGALLVLVGMLVQVAGQPLPARARARA